MNLQAVKRIYFIGIGGIGMSGLARYFKAKGKEVSGYDKTPTPLTDELISEGIAIHFTDDLSLVGAKNELVARQKEMLVVYTPAIPKEHAELIFFKENGFEVKKRAEILGMITGDSFNIAVAGTHGKTTTTSMMAHVLKYCGINCTAFLGGISKNYNTNLLLADQQSKPETVVVEADEYDRSFLFLTPDIGIITSMDADHLDIYGSHANMITSYKDFAKKIKSGGTFFARYDLGFGKECTTYSLDNHDADYFASDIRVVSHRYQFDFHSKTSSIKGIKLGMPGMHNIENAVVVIATGLQLGISGSKIKDALEAYTGVRRRFDLQYSSPTITYIDDYAHHPEELRACISSVKELYPDKKITGIFQPHLFSRTNDFADGFAKSLSMLDELILLDIYPARELPIPGVTSEIILEKATCTVKRILTKEQTIKELSKIQDGLILTLGAGDIDQLVVPIKTMLENK